MTINHCNVGKLHIEVMPIHESRSSQVYRRIEQSLLFLCRGSMWSMVRRLFLYIALHRVKLPSFENCFGTSAQGNAEEE